MSNEWKIIERLEHITDHLDEINDYLDQVHEAHISYNNWIQAATDSLLKLQKEVNYLRNKKDCI